MDQKISYKLPLTIFREGEQFVAYSPALDLSSCGKNEEHAKRMFAEAVEAFFEDLIDMGTIDSVLKDLGWLYTTLSTKPLLIYSAIYVE